MNDITAALLLLKPDALIGPYADCHLTVARDVIRGLCDVYEPQTGVSYEMPASAQAVAWGTRNIARKAAEREWYTTTLNNHAQCLAALRRYLTAPELAGSGRIALASLVLGIANSLGFTVVTRRSHICTYRDFLGLYAHNTHYTRLAADLRNYLVGARVDVILLRGTQTLSALHITKELIRRVVRYPTSHYDALENLLHVSDPHSTDWIYFEHLLCDTH